MTATIRQRNVILGDHVGHLDPGFRHFECGIRNLHDTNEQIDRAPNPMELLTVPCHKKLNLVT